MSGYGDTVIVITALDLARAIRSRRRALGWSQEHLADEAGVSRQWVVAVEGGKELAALGPVLRAIAALGLTIDLVDAPPLHGEVDLDAVLG